MSSLIEFEHDPAYRQVKAAFNVKDQTSRAMLYQLLTHVRKNYGCRLRDGLALLTYYYQYVFDGDLDGILVQMCDLIPISNENSSGSSELQGRRNEFSCRSYAPPPNSCKTTPKQEGNVPSEAHSSSGSGSSTLINREVSKTPTRSVNSNPQQNTSGPQQFSAEMRSPLTANMLQALDQNGAGAGNYRMERIEKWKLSAESYQTKGDQPLPQRSEFLQQPSTPSTSHQSQGLCGDVSVNNGICTGMTNGFLSESYTPPPSHKQSENVQRESQNPSRSDPRSVLPNEYNVPQGQGFRPTSQKQNKTMPTNAVSSSGSAETRSVLPWEEYAPPPQGFKPPYHKQNESAPVECLSSLGSAEAMSVLSWEYHASSAQGCTAIPTKPNENVPANSFSSFDSAGKNETGAVHIPLSTSESVKKEERFVRTPPPSSKAPKTPIGSSTSQAPAKDHHQASGPSEKSSERKCAVCEKKPATLECRSCHQRLCCEDCAGLPMICPVKSCARKYPGCLKPVERITATTYRRPTGTYCRRCEEKPAEVYLLPCQHKVCCVDCAESCRLCPHCHQSVSGRSKQLKKVEKPSYQRKSEKPSYCMKCKLKPADMMFRPCLHAVTCFECGSICDTCPACLSDITGTVDQRNHSYI